MFKISAAMFVGAFLFASPLVASADTQSDLQAQLNALLTQIGTLPPQTGTTKSSKVTSCVNITNRLGLGDSDDGVNGEVSKLQTFLGVQVIGYFNMETMQVVKDFQASRNIVSFGDPESTGYGAVGPLTRAAMRCGGENDARFVARPGYGQVPLAVEFLAAVGGAGYVIDFGDGGWGGIYSIAPVAERGYGAPPHTYINPGTYTAKLYYQPSPYTSDCSRSNPDASCKVIGTATVTVKGPTLGAPTLTGTAPKITKACPFPSTWTRSPGSVKRVDGSHLSPLLTSSDPSVLYEDGLYKIWFTNADSKDHVGIAYATSPDGKKWTVWKKSTDPDPIMDLVLAPEETWNTVGLETANVMKTPGGEYRMYYSENLPPEGSYTFAIGLATSQDGIKWKRHGTQSVMLAENAWEKPTCVDASNPASCSNGGVLEPTVIYDVKDKIYKMWYAGLGAVGDVSSFRIGYATSPDGIAWKRRAEPVFVGGGSGAWDESWVSHVNVIPDPVLGYHMFYFGGSGYTEGGEMQKGSIGHAYSVDGITWKRDPQNPILKPTSGFEAWAVGGPHAIFRNGSFELFYFGNKDATVASDINFATAKCSTE